MKEHAGDIVEYHLSGGNLTVNLPNDFWLKDDIFYYAIPRIVEGYKEIIIAPISPENWKYVWEFRFNIKHDQPGIIYTITDVLQENKINIYKHEGYTPRENIEFSFWVLGSIESFLVENNALDLKNEQVKELLSNKLNESFLKIEESGDVANIDKANIRLWDTSSVELFHENNIDAHDNNINQISKKELVEFFTHPIYFEVKKGEATFEYPRLLNALGIKYNDKSSFYGTIFTDLVQRNFYILRFFHNHQRIIYFDVRHKHDVGVIHRLAREIYRDNGYNVLYNRAIIKKDHETKGEIFGSMSHWYVLLEVSPNYNINELFMRLEASPLTPQLGAINVINYTEGFDFLNAKYKKEVQKEKKIKMKSLVNYALNPILIIGNLIFLVYLGLHSKELLEIWGKNEVLMFVFAIGSLGIFLNKLKGVNTLIKNYFNS